MALFFLLVSLYKANLLHIRKCEKRKPNENVFHFLRSSTKIVSFTNIYLLYKNKIMSMTQQQSLSINNELQFTFSTTKKNLFLFFFVVCILNSAKFLIKCE